MLSTDCARYEELLGKPDLTEEELTFCIEHPESCPSGLHTYEALEDENGWPRGTLRTWNGRGPLPRPNSLARDRYRRRFSEMIEDDSSSDTGGVKDVSNTSPAFLREHPVEKPTGPILWVPTSHRVTPLGELHVSRRSFLQDAIAAAVIASAAAAELLDSESQKGEWISREVFNEFQHHYMGSTAPPDRKEMLAHLLKPGLITKYIPARDHPHLPRAGREGYLRDRLALEAFMQLEDHLPQRLRDQGAHVEIGPRENLVLSGSPRSNAQARLFLPFRDLTSVDDELISNTFRPELVPYHFIVGPGEVGAKTFIDGHWQQLLEPSFAIDRGGELWRPRDPVDAEGRLSADFLLVSRLPHPNGGDVIIIAGGHGAGTEAFRLIFDKNAFSDEEFHRLFRMLEGHRYFQFVLGCHDIAHNEDGSHAHRLAIPDNCPPVIISRPDDLFKKY